MGVVGDQLRVARVILHLSGGLHPLACYLPTSEGAEKPWVSRDGSHCLRGGLAFPPSLFLHSIPAQEQFSLFFPIWGRYLSNSSAIEQNYQRNSGGTLRQKDSKRRQTEEREKREKKRVKKRKRKKEEGE